MHALVPSQKLINQVNQVVSRNQPFEMLYSLNCQNLCGDFHEDLDFRFSWGITALIQRFTGKAKDQNQRRIMHRENSVASVSFNFSCYSKKIKNLMNFRCHLFCLHQYFMTQILQKHWHQPLT